MRKLIVSMQVSVDGFVEGPDRDMSWVNSTSEDLWQDIFGVLKTVDLMLLGGGMYADYRNYWKQALNNPEASFNEVAYACLAEKTRHIVCSNSLKNPQWENTEVISGDVVAIIKDLKQQAGKDILVLGGAQMAATVADAGLVDEYRLVTRPIILGAGKSFLHLQHRRQHLQLVSIKAICTGELVARYKVV